MMILYKLHFVSLTACIALQTCMFSTADKSGVGQDWKFETDDTLQNSTRTASNITQKYSKYSRMTGYEEEDIKPAEILDFIDNNLKKVVIGVIAVVAVIIITLVCCCVCCAATVCNRATKQLRDTKPKHELYAAEVQ